MNLFVSDTTSVFTYYWQVSQFNEMLKSWHTGRSMRSRTFYAGHGGYAMYLRVTPKYFPDGTIFVGAGLTAGRYDSILTWPFPHRIRLEVCKGVRRNQRYVNSMNISYDISYEFKVKFLKDFRIGSNIIAKSLCRQFLLAEEKKTWGGAIFYRGCM